MAKLLSPACTDALKVQNQLQGLSSRGRWSTLSKNSSGATWNPMIGQRRKFGRIKVATQDSGSSSAFADDYYAVLGLVILLNSMFLCLDNFTYFYMFFRLLANPQ